MKKTFLIDGETKQLDFAELHEQFFNMIQNESWKLMRIYGGQLSKDEVEQQFTIELWYAFENYDYTTGNAVSTYVYNRFLKAKRDLLYPIMDSKKEKWNKQNSSLDKKQTEDDRDDSSNKAFSNDATFEQMEEQNAQALLEGEGMMTLIFSHFQKSEDLDLIRVLINKKDFSVADYAAKYDVSRMGANKRLQKMKDKLSEILLEEWL